MRVEWTGALAAALTIVGHGGVGAAERPLALRSIEGSYKHYFRSEMIGGGPYRALDDLLVLPLGPSTAYVEVGLSFVNGHECGIAGVAAVRGATLLLRKADPDRECRLTLRVARGAVTLDDADRNCQRSSCGARGGYTGATFHLSWRKPVAGAAAMRRSEEVRKAVSEFEELSPDPAGTER